MRPLTKLLVPALSWDDPPEAGPPWQDRAVVLTGWICLAATLGWIVYRVWPALFIPWWFNTDETVFYYEVVRQLRLDLSQRFFAIPGTPYMTLSSLSTLAWWAVERVVGSTANSPGDFAFENIQGVHVLMRGLVLGMYLVAVVIVFDMIRRSAGALVAFLTAFLFATLPIHVHYSYFVRTESLGLVLCLSAIWIVLYHRRRGTPQIYGWAGVLAGAAMAARFHFVLVAPVVILAIFLLRDRDKLPPGPAVSGYRALYAAGGALGAMFVCGAVITLMQRNGIIPPGWVTHLMMITTVGGPALYPTAKASVATLWLLLGVVAGVLLILHGLPKGRRWIRPLVNPFTLMFAVGFSAGFLVTNPAFLWRGESQLFEFQYYHEWIDPELQSIHPVHSWLNVARYYFATALPEIWSRLAFLAGAALILWRRHPVHLAFLAGGVACFVAHPVTMKLWAHHMIPWLPFLCFVAAWPAGLAGKWMSRRWRRPSAGVAMVLVAMAGALVVCQSRLERADEYLLISRDRTDQIAQANEWLARNVPAGTRILRGYYAMNEEAILQWIEGEGVRVPAFVKRDPNVEIWWLNKSTIEGRAGILCIAPMDITVFREDLERRDPGSTYDPFENPAFEPMARFGEGMYAVHIFKFDFRRRRTS